jgi:RNA polymerase sigma-70 factor (ECF subfamily)
VFAGEESHEVMSVVGTDAAGFERFYVQTGRRSLSLAYALTGSWADAEDLVQDAYSAASRSWTRLSEYDDPAAWVRRAIVNRSASRWRRLGREVRAVTRLAARSSPTVTHNDSGDESFWHAVARLPTRQRQVVALFYVEDLTVAQVADRLACAEGTVKAHLSRARVALHETLVDDRGGIERDQH